MKYNRGYFVNKIIDNIKLTNNGSIIASPSNHPNYFYHWIRDSAITMKVIVNEYELTKDLKYLDIILQYVNFEFEIQNIETIAGLGEPKYNVDGSSFNEEWGRPQNDGPALRGIIMIKIARLLQKKFSSITKKIINTIIENDLKYIIDNIDKPSFDLWEEIYGYHFYTRLVQAKFIKEYIKYTNNLQLNIYYEKIKKYITHHYSYNNIISSFNIDGTINRDNDSSIFLGIEHIDYDNDIFPIDKYELVENNIYSLRNYFNIKYEKDYNLIGRYINDNYFNGQSWFICTISMLNFYKKINKNINLVDTIYNHIIHIDKNLNLNEQYNPKENKMYSVEKLTWNYSELYFLNK
jgi:glucoamylase